jgi:hypothetical protein
VGVLHESRLDKLRRWFSCMAVRNVVAFTTVLIFASLVGLASIAVFRDGSLHAQQPKVTSCAAGKERVCPFLSAAALQAPVTSTD